MSDDEYAFEYSDEEQEAPQEDDVAVQIENTYYGSKGMLESDVGAAEAGFKEVLEMEKGKPKGDGSLAEWGFKATKQLVKLFFRRGEYDAMLTWYRCVQGVPVHEARPSHRSLPPPPPRSDLLRRIKAGAVTRNRAEKTINSILDLVSSSSDSAHLPAFYDTTLEALASGGGNERLAFKTRTKQARLYLSAKDWARLRPLLAQLQAACSAGSGAGAGIDMATQLVEVYALQVAMASELRDTRKVAELVAKADAVRSAVPHPAITGVLREAAGKMHMRERAWEEARVAFQDAFKSFEEAGNTARTVTCLQYMLLANMLSNSRINPFDDQSSKAYERDPSVAASVALTDAYLSGDMRSFESALRSAGAGTGGLDDFVAGYISDLLRTMRTGVALTLLAPYDRVRFAWLGRELGVSPAEAEALASSLIHEGRLAGAIDGPAGVLILGRGAGAGTGAGVAPAQAGPGLGPGSTEGELLELAKRLTRLISTISTANGASGGSGGPGGMEAMMMRAGRSRPYIDSSLVD
jgi:COP9 signalosome complex subunit 2